jgi:hypothetical protein
VARLQIAAFVVLGALLTFVPGANVSRTAEFATLDQRPLNLPVLHPGDRCPVSKGSSNTVPRDGDIFCAACVWFGTGSVYFALAWQDHGITDATFRLDPVPFEHGAYRAKTPWVSKPGFLGPILIRGQQLDGAGENKLRFSFGRPEPKENLQLDAEIRKEARAGWSFWATSMWIQNPGCYGVQIDTTHNTELVIFSATNSVSAPDPPSTRQTVRESEVPTTTSSKIDGILLALKDPNVSRASLSQQLVDQMISLAEKGHQPSRPIVTAFADELTRALKGQKLDKSQITAVKRSIVEMMQEPVSNLEPACHLRETLTAIGIDNSKIQLIVRDFIAVGEAVRGADDSPLKRH